MAAPDYNAPPIRPGAAPTLDVVQAGLSTLGGTQPGYLRITEALVKTLRYHFSDPTRIEYPSLVDRVWVAGETSPIQITSLAEWDPRKSSQRPALLVDRLDQNKDLERRGIGDQLMGALGGTGAYRHFMLGQHVVHCLGGREGEAELLAAEVWRELARFAPKIREVLCLLRFLPYRVGKRVQLDEHKEHYSIPVLIGYGYDETWKLTPLDEDEITLIQSVVPPPTSPPPFPQGFSPGFDRGFN